MFEKEESNFIFFNTKYEKIFFEYELSNARWTRWKWFDYAILFWIYANFCKRKFHRYLIAKYIEKKVKNEQDGNAAPKGESKKDNLILFFIDYELRTSSNLIHYFYSYKWFRKHFLANKVKRKIKNHTKYLEKKKVNKSH